MALSELALPGAVYGVSWRAEGETLVALIDGQGFDQVELRPGESAETPGHRIVFRGIASVPAIPVLDMPRGETAGVVNVQMPETADGRPYLFISRHRRGERRDRGEGRRSKRRPGYRYRFGGRVDASGIDIRRDPGDLFIWVAVGLAMLGLGVTFYVPRRRLWVRVTDQRTQLAGRRGAHDALRPRAAPDGRGARRARRAPAGGRGGRGRRAARVSDISSLSFHLVSHLAKLAPAGACDDDSKRPRGEDAVVAPTRACRGGGGCDHCAKRQAGRAPRAMRAAKGKRQFGSLKGRIKLDESFFDPLPEEDCCLGRRLASCASSSTRTPSSGGSKAASACPPQPPQRLQTRRTKFSSALHLLGKSPRNTGWADCPTWMSSLAAFPSTWPGNASRGCRSRLRMESVLGRCPDLHRDPFDRMLIAQALQENLVLVSSERTFDRYGVQRLW